MVESPVVKPPRTKTLTNQRMDGPPSSWTIIDVDLSERFPQKVFFAWQSWHKHTTLPVCNFDIILVYFGVLGVWSLFARNL